jgi:hypothetical protein
MNLAEYRNRFNVLPARAGYTLENPDQLLHDLRTQILLLDATPLEAGKFASTTRFAAR